jgi:hypothetical protein
MPTETSKVLAAAVKLAEATCTPVADIITPWGLAQDLDLYQQLIRGIRYFDFRSGWHCGTWYTFHYELGHTSETLLRDVARFASEHPGEVVILELTHFEGNPSAAALEGLEDLVMSTLGPILYPVDYSFSRTVNDLTSTGQRVLVTMENRSGRYDHLIWSGDTIYNTFANSDHLDQMLDYNRSRIAEFLGGAESSRLYKISYTLTPQVGRITDKPVSPKTLLELADTAGERLVAFYKELRSEGRVPWGNIVIIDHFQASPFLEVILDMNGLVSIG